MNGRAPLRLALGLVAGLVFAGSLAAQSTFYEAYDLGLKAEREGRWEEARERFLNASASRPEAARRVRTYGMNFLETYDPYLHLARAAFHLKRLDEAKEALGRARAAGVSPPAEVAELQASIDAARSPLVPTARPAAPGPAVPTRTAPIPPTSVPLPSSSPSPVAVPTRGAIVPAEAVREPVRTVTAEEARPRRTLPPSAPLVAERASPGPAPTVLPETAPSVSAALATPPGPAAREPGPGSPGVLPGLLGGAAIVALAAGIALLLGRLRRGAARESGSGPTNAEGQRTRVLAPGTAEGRAFGDYVLEGVLGLGGMGTTYRARRLRDSLVVAIKVPHESLLDKPDFVRRFLREGALGATLHHPGIIRIYEAGEFEGRPFIAMELIEGTTLEERLRSGGPLPLREALEITRQIALTLDYAHMKGVVHRDLKPENVMLLRDGHLKVMDYGIARQLGAAGLTATGIYLGTPVYSPPESLTPAEVDAQSDLYSLGVILFRMLSGSLPFTGTTPLDVLKAQAFAPLPAFDEGLGVPDPVRGIVERLTAKAKSDRTPTAELLLREVDAVLNAL